MWIVVSLGLTLRDSWLIAHGGGTSPKWLLRAEVVAFTASATGATVLAAPTTARRAGRRPIEIATATTGSAAVAFHLARLARYLRRRAIEDRP